MEVFARLTDGDEIFGEINVAEYAVQQDREAWVRSTLPSIPADRDISNVLEALDGIVEKLIAEGAEVVRVRTH